MARLVAAQSREPSPSCFEVQHSRGGARVLGRLSCRIAGDWHIRRVSMRDSSSGKKVFFGAGSDLAFAVLKVQFWVDNTEIRDYFTGIWFHEHT